MASTIEFFFVAAEAGKVRVLHLLCNRHVLVIRCLCNLGMEKLKASHTHTHTVALACAQSESLLPVIKGGRVCICLNMLRPSESNKLRTERLAMECCQV